MTTENNSELNQETTPENEHQLLSTEEKVDLIENQLHRINLKLLKPEKKAWWKLNIPIIISIFALITSIGFSYYGIKRDNSKDIKETQKEIETSKAARIESINNLILKLTEIQEKNLKLASENPNVDINGISVLSNYQRLIYVNKILDLMDEINHEFPPEVYALIGNELKIDGQFSKAKIYYMKELANAKTPTSKVVAYRDLANVFGIPETSFHNQDSSRFFWRMSLSFSDSIVGEQKLHFKAYSYQLWAGNEFYFDNPQFANKLVDSAKVIYSKLPIGSTAKDFNINRLNQMVQFYNSRNVSSKLYNLTGEWSTGKNSNLKVKVSFYQNMNGLNCNMLIYELGKVIYNLSGSYISMSDNHLTFNIQGVKKYYKGIIIASVLLFPDRNKLNKINVELYELNEKVKKFSLYKK